MTTYIYENNEVKITERTATRHTKSGKQEILYEITPVDESVGRWKKWVMLAQLYTVNNITEK